MRARLVETTETHVVVELHIPIAQVHADYAAAERSVARMMALYLGTALRRPVPARR